MIVLPKGASLNGALSYLFYSVKNYYDEYFEIESSEILWGNPRNLINYDVNGSSQSENCATTNISNSYYTIHLKSQVLAITHYTLKSRTSGGVSFPMSFLIEASNDNVTYQTLHSIDSTTDLCGLGLMKTYRTKRIGAFQYFRIRQTGLTYSSANNLVLHKIELFGNLCPVGKECKFPQRCSYNRIRHSSTFTPLLYIIFVK